MSPSTVKMICPENEDDVSSGTECDNYCDGTALEKLLIIMKGVLMNPIMIMTMTTPVTVICRNQKPIAMMTINNAIE